MDLRTAREAARVRARASTAATGLSALLAIVSALSALSAPDEARPLLWGAAAVATATTLACWAIASANRALRERAEDAAAPLTTVRLALLAAVGAWVAVVAVVSLMTGDVSWFLGALGLVTLLLPAAAMAGITLKGPHPTG